ncbi:MAG: DUF2330 domain-containing protein [bacterium]|nr:DUF2330 domain-containing protein [bacterium]
MPNRIRVTATLVLNLALAVTAAVPALADGAMFAPWGYELYETEQIAVVEHDAAAGAETLHVLPGFRTESSGFAWIVPVPALPEVGVSDFDIFQDAVGLTAPVWRCATRPGAARIRTSTTGPSTTPTAWTSSTTGWSASTARSCSAPTTRRRWPTP